MVRLSKASLAQRSVVLLLSLLVIALGVYAAGALKQELIPSIDLPRGSVLTIYPGASPEVVEAQLSKPIESAVKAVAGVTSVTSKSSSGVSQVSVQWDYGLKPDDMANKIRSAIDSISTGLPSSVNPKVITGSFDDIPIVVLALSSSDDSTMLTSKVNQIVVPGLKTIDGVRDVAVGGQETREIMISYSPAELNKKNIDPSLIGQLFAANATAFPSGTMRTDNANLDVQTGRTYSTAEQIAGLQLPTADGPIKLGDVAKVTEQPVETTSISRVGGKTALTLQVTKEAGANTVSVAKAVGAMLPQLEQQLGGNATFTTVFDQAPYIEQSIHDLSVEGGIGLAMAVLVILIFLGSLRPTVITAISIPLSLLIALIGLWVGGYSLNILTLAALTVAIGRVVDDSIVVIENIKRHQGYGEFGRKSILNAVREVAGAVTSSTLTTVAVFLPIGLVGGQAGEIFRPFALTVTIALAASLFVSLTLVPVLASWFMRPTAKQQARQQVVEPEAEKDTWLQKAYLPVLNWSLAHRWITATLAFVLFAGTMALTPLLKTDFLGEQGNESLMISQKLPAGTSLAETDAAARKIEQLLSSDQAVQTYSTSIGGSGSSFLGTQADTNQANYTVPLKAGYSAKDVVGRIRDQIGALGSSMGTVEVSVGNSSSSVVVYVEGSDQVALKAANDQVVAMMKDVPDLVNVTSDLSEARDQLSVKVDDRKAADLGMTQLSIGQAVSRAVAGQQVGSIAVGDDTLKVYLRVKSPAKSIEQLRDAELPVTQLMSGNAKKDAAEKVSDDSKALQDESKDASDKAYNDQVKALKKARSQAKSAQASLASQLSKAKKNLASLQKQLNAALAIPLCSDRPDLTPPACSPVGTSAAVFQLTQAVSGMSMQVAQLGGALAQAKSGTSSVDKQLDALATQREKSLEAQDKQQAIQDASKDAQDATAKPVTLSAVAKVEVVQAPATVTRVDGVRSATISASSESADLGATTAQIQKGLAALNLPDGISYRIGGVSAQQAESFAQLGLAMLVAIAVVYLIMVATFGSLLQPLILLVSIPFAATGALAFSLISDTALGLPSMIGLLMLIGIVVTNAIVLIDLINQKRKAGLSVDASIAAGARLRVRPIIMTALATVFALVPMSLGLTGGGVFISKPLAIVVIGGLVSSTLLTLILVPVLYDLLETWRERRETKRDARRAARLADAVAAQQDAAATEA
ncbi:multidrug efflux pump subunit AcrB [Propionicimonas paludicola]|uniref:Multidrug efflux pump subunit AcrB n=2 Tax=Propionicimonas paludicola TaxID=185243 RepID=A0A2A9CWQ2_9ACTN|nr:efflux RND transporter permease subunit [Propionicimonas paludicola]PFG18060.1 multidrug efflux pump subunit AcrB [Propionicimonas paludicola]